MRFPIVLWLCMFLRFLHPKTTYKSSQLFEKGVASDKFTLAFWNTSFWFWQNCDLRYFVLTFVNIFQDMFLFTILAPQKSPKKKKKKRMITSLWKRSGFRQVYFHCLKYMFIALTKLWFFFVTFVNIFEIMFSFYGVFNQKTPNNYHRLVKWV